MRQLFSFSFLLAVLSLFTGCVSTPDKDYTTFRKLQPKSILVLPPLNNAMDERATYSYLSTVTRPLAEYGYYVFPVAVIDNFLKENGMPTPGEMHQVSLAKVDEIIGADAVLYIEINEYGTEYLVLSSNTTVSADARLVDVKTGEEIWQGTKTVVRSNDSGGGGIAEMIISALINQVINNSVDAAHGVSAMTNWGLISESGQGLLYGPRHELFGTEEL